MAYPGRLVQADQVSGNPLLEARCRDAHGIGWNGAIMRVVEVALPTHTCYNKAKALDESGE